MSDSNTRRDTFAGLCSANQTVTALGVTCRRIGPASTSGRESRRPLRLCQLTKRPQYGAERLHGIDLDYPHSGRISVGTGICLSTSTARCGLKLGRTSRRRNDGGPPEKWAKGPTTSRRLIALPRIVAAREAPTGITTTESSATYRGPDCRLTPRSSRRLMRAGESRSKVVQERLIPSQCSRSSAKACLFGYFFKIRLRLWRYGR